MTGPPHVGLNGIDIDTPHVHIFDEDHYNGTQVEPLNKISDEEIINELHDSLVAFLLYNNVDIKKYITTIDIDNERSRTICPTHPNS